MVGVIALFLSFVGDVVDRGFYRQESWR